MAGHDHQATPSCRPMAPFETGMMDRPEHPHEHERMKESAVSKCVQVGKRSHQRTYTQQTHKHAYIHTQTRVPLYKQTCIKMFKKKTEGRLWRREKKCRM